MSAPGGAAALPPGVAVAYSGGRDSTALLYATVRVAHELGLHVHALHVHHGLSAHADHWLEHGRAACAAWADQGWPVSFHARRIHVDPRGRGIEAAARDGRYRALAAMARDAGCDLVLLAHHREDQAETVLLQALRGAGIAGLAAMPRQAQRGGVIWIRPWLARPRAELQAYVDRHDLRHVEDDSNADPRHARNRLRLQVWPVISAGHDAAADALVQVARHAQEAKACLQALAEIDLARAVRDDGLDIVALHELTPPRRANALRHWLGATVGQPPAASLLQRLATQLDVSRALSWPIDGEHELRLYRGVLRVARVDACAGRVAPVAPAVREQRMQVTAPGVYPLPGWGGVLVVELAGADAATAGVAAFVDLAQLVQVELRARSGAERFQLGLCRPARSLKKQFQALAVPEGARGGPVLWIGERLLFVPGLGVDASWHEAARRAAQPCTLAWRSLVVPMLQRGG